MENGIELSDCRPELLPPEELTAESLLLVDEPDAVSFGFLEDVSEPSLRVGADPNISKSVL